jgi:hypothetical protein
VFGRVVTTKPAANHSNAWRMVAAVLFIAIARWNLVVALGLTVFGIYLWGVAWGVRRWRRAREDIRAALQQAGYEIVQMKYRRFRKGPFPFWKTSSYYFVYRILVCQPGGGQRVVWARWGRYWFGYPDKLELSWESELGY